MSMAIDDARILLVIRACSPTFLTALRNTGQRLQDVPDEPQEVLEALASWMSWALAVDEALRRGRPNYEQQALDPVGRALPGLSHAWNQLKHDAQSLDDLVLMQRARSYPRVYPWSYEIRWLDALPEFPRRGRQPAKEVREKEKRSYEDHLAGHLVRELPPDVTRFLLTQADEGREP